MSDAALPLNDFDLSALYRKDHFDMPEGLIYLDGNSLGPLPKAVPSRMADAVSREWGNSLVKGWNEAGWFKLPSVVASQLEPLIGAEPGSVSVGDSTSINLFKVLSAALKMSGSRRRILSDSGNFPSDLYIAEGLVSLMGSGFHLIALPSDKVEAAIDDNVAVVMLTEVDYRTGKRRNMQAVTLAAHAAGALVIWDLSHSAGALPVRLADCNADFAVGCGYKFLNGGPGAPAFLYVAPSHAENLVPTLSGWMGHSAPFAFESSYRPASGIEKMQAGTPPILSLIAFSTALELFKELDLEALHARSLQLGDLFIGEMARRCPDLELATPRDHRLRGSQVSFRHPNGYEVMQALIARDVIGDFRSPDIIRFGITPLYISEDDIIRASATLEQILRDRLWDADTYRVRAAVT